MPGVKPLPGSAQGYESKRDPATPYNKAEKSNSGNKFAKDVTNRGSTSSGRDSRPLTAGTSCPYDHQK